MTQPDSPPAAARHLADRNGAAAVAAFHRLVADEWEYRLKEDPLFATQVGDVRHNHRLPASSAADFERRHGVLRQFRGRLDDLDHAALPAAEQLNYDIFGRLLDNEIGEHQHRAYLLPLSKAFGFHTFFPELPALIPLLTTLDYENYIARLQAFLGWTEDHVDLMAVGLRQGFVPARATLDGVAEAAAAQVVAPEASPLYRPFTAFPPTVPETERARLTQAGLHALRQSVIPAYQALEAFLREVYVPAARDTVAAADLPDGAAFYQHRIRYYTSLDLTPDSIHATGQAEVARIRAEMETLVARTGFEGGFRGFIEHLRTDPRFYAQTPEALLKETAYVLKRMDGELPRLFKTLPRLPYGIRVIPEYAAAGSTTAYYQPGSGDGTRAGRYYVNTTDLPSRPLYEIEALSLHEAVPGHHLQIALQQELAELPMFRRFGGFTAFVEGWALYAERLGLEVGFYTDPYSDFGRLSYEMWRACRLVVDTGMHALGWTRQQAIDFMADNTSSTLLNIANEVDRYIAWPGQALAYKIGELKIRELRAQAEAALGPAFDLRAFHDVLLRQGAVPLDVLENMVEHWISLVKHAA
jgi:uncharacterized protein (DUF885 family)